jgi:hypothetical protein
MALVCEGERDSGCWAAEAGQANSQLAAEPLRERCVMECLVYKIISVRILIHINKKFDPNQSFIRKPVNGSRLF